MKKIIYVCLLIVWMIVIFLFSSRNGFKSTNDSNSFINKTIIAVYKIFDHEPSDEKINQIVETFSYPVRKAAHFTEYFILGILMFLVFKEFNNKDIYLIILLCIIYAMSDEFHQLFVLGRDGSIKDVFIDSMGSCSSILLMKNIILKNDNT